MHRVQKLLSNYGYCSRRKAEEIIKEGRVKVNDNIISIGDKASEDDNIYVDGKVVSREKRVYLMFNKPKGCVTALHDKHYKTVMDYIKVKERIFPIGRLDRDTTGLLLLTNDGDIANKIMHPSNEIDKTYVAKLDKPITDEQISMIEKGVMLEDGKTSEAKVKKHDAAHLEITIHEGKNRIIRRILEKLGFEVLSLERIKVGDLSLGDLKVGKYRELTEKEIKILG